MIELHSVPHQPGPLQDIELALVSQALLRFAWLQLKRAFNGPESYVCLLTQSVQNSNIITFERKKLFDRIPLSQSRRASVMVRHYSRSSSGRQIRRN
jgi:hypothetical protein